MLEEGSLFDIDAEKVTFLQIRENAGTALLFFFLTEIAGNLHGPKNADLENMRKCQGSALIVQHITGLNKGDLG